MPEVLQASRGQVGGGSDMPSWPEVPGEAGEPGEPALPAAPSLPTPTPAQAPTPRHAGFLRRHGVLAALAAVAAVYLVTLALLPLDGIWINDIGNRIVQVRSILASDYSDYSIAWPGVDLDPSYDFAPLAYPFATIRDDKLFSVYPPFLPTVSSVFFKFFGYPGLYVIPFAASLALLAALARLVTEIGGDLRARAYAVLLAGLGTPLWFYSVNFWEHVPVVALLVWSLVCAMRFLAGGRRRHLVAAAALSAFAAYFRVDVYAFSLALLVVLVSYAPGRRLPAALGFAAVTVAALVPLWLFHWWALGSPGGHHLSALVGPDLASHLAARPKVFFNLFLRASPSAWVSLLLTLPLVILLILNPRLPERSFRVAIPVLGMAGFVIAGFVYTCFFTTERPIACLGFSNSLFPAAPVLALGLVRPKGQSVEASRRIMLWVLVLVYAAAYWLTVPEKASWGIHWGGRYLLVIYPLLVAAVALNLSRWQSLVHWRGRGVEGRGVRGRRMTRACVLSWAAVIALVAASLAAQVLSITILERRMDFSSRLNREVARRPEAVIVTNQWWVGQELHSQFCTKPIFLVGSQEGFDDLAARLAARGKSDMLFVGPALLGRGPEAGAVRVSDNGLKLWSVDLVPLSPGARYPR
jgi:hypothetical protein